MEKLVLRGCSLLNVVLLVFRSAFFANNPGQEAHWLPVLAMESSGYRHHCGNCEWDFRSDQDLLKHELEEHQVGSMMHIFC